MAETEGNGDLNPPGWYETEAYKKTLHYQFGALRSALLELHYTFFNAIAEVFIGKSKER